MYKKWKRAATAMLALVLALSLSLPIAAIAESSGETEASANTNSVQNSSALGTYAAELAQAKEESAAYRTAAYTADKLSGATDLIDEEAAFDADIAAEGAQQQIKAIEQENSTESGTDSSTTTPETDCVLTILYYEYPTYLEPGVPPNEEGLYLLGERKITGLTQGQVVNAWNYVVYIPGYFFFDGWPAKPTISTDPSQNVIKLFYGRQWNYEYTVNYYVMEGADLSADNWKDALAPEEVTFKKFGTETFVDQPYGKLVEGDAYAYQLDGAYVVDSYPANIRVGTDPDNNVLNVLYATDSPRLPNVFDPADGPAIFDPDTADTPDTDNPDGSIGGIDGVVPPPNNSSDNNVNGSGSSNESGSVNGSTSNGTNKPTLPNDTVFDKDEFIQVLPGGNGTLPDGMTQEEVDKLFKDFIESQPKEGPIEITDEMLANPIDPKVARATIAAYMAGLERGAAGTESALAGAHKPFYITHLLCIALIIVLTILAIVGFGLYLHERRKTSELLDQTNNSNFVQSATP